MPVPTCNNFVLHCMDFRIQQSLHEFKSERGLLGDCDIVAYGGPCQEHELALRYIDLSRRIHKITHVVLSQHEDCGGYGGTERWGSRHKERQVLEHDMQVLRKKVLVKHPAIRVSMVFFERSGDRWQPIEITPD